MDGPDGDRNTGAPPAKYAAKNALISHCHLDQSYFYTQMAVLAVRTVLPSPQFHVLMHVLTLGGFSI